MLRQNYQPFTRRYAALHAHAIDGYVSDNNNIAPRQSPARREPQEALPIMPKTSSSVSAEQASEGLEQPHKAGDDQLVNQRPQRKPHTRKVRSDKYISDSDSSSPPSPTTVGQIDGDHFNNDERQASFVVEGYRRSLVNPRIAALSHPVHVVGDIRATSSFLDPSSSSNHSTTVRQGEQDSGHKTDTHDNSFGDTGVNPQDLANFPHRTNGAGISSAGLHYDPSSSSINNFEQDEHNHNNQLDNFTFDHRMCVGSGGIASSAPYSGFLDPYDSNDNLEYQPHPNFTSNPFEVPYRITHHSPVFRIPSPSNHLTSSASLDKMRLTTPTISWAFDKHGYLEPQADRQFIKIEDEDQFTYSDRDEQQEVELKDDRDYGEVDENEHDDDGGKVWLAGSYRDDWLKMTVDVEEQLRDAQIIEDAGNLKNSVELDNEVVAEVAAKEAVCKTLGQEGRKLSINEYVEIQERRLPHMSDEEVASLIGGHVAEKEYIVDVNDLESERTLVHYEELLVSIIHRLLDAKATERVEHEIERSGIITTIRQIKSNIEAKKKKEEGQKSAYPTPPPSQDSNSPKLKSEREDLAAQAASKRKREDKEDDDKLNEGIIDMDAPKAKKKRKTHAEIAAENEAKLKAKEAKEAARIAAQEQKERDKEAEKEPLKAEKAGEKERHKTPAQREAEARKEATEREKVAKARGLATGKKGGATAWKTKAPWEAGRWNTRYQVAAVEQEAETDMEQGE